MTDIGPLLRSNRAAYFGRRYLMTPNRTLTRRNLAPDDGAWGRTCRSQSRPHPKPQKTSRSHGRVEQARQLLAPVYGGFTERFDTLDLKEATGLLGELAS
jgi:hypothetical protein